MPVDLSVLNSRQREAVSYTGGPLLVLAGAGTGKTRVIVHRVAYLVEQGVPAHRILAVTFTNKAAEEMKRRIAALIPGQAPLVWVQTFHSLALRLLREHHQQARLPRHFTIYDETDQKKLIAEVLKAQGFSEHSHKAGLYVNLISRAKDDLLDADSYAIYAGASPDAHRKTAAVIYSEYQKRLQASGAVDFGDLLLKVNLLFKEHPEILKRYQERFLHILIDEYQDTNHSQYVLTKALANGHRELCVVGDDDQSVYSWRGADIRNILEFERDFPNAKVVTLDENYRSTPEILKAANRVIGHNLSRKSKKLWTTRGTGDPIRSLELPDEREEASRVVREISHLASEGRSLREIAIFYRTNAQSRLFEESLRAAGFPYRLIGAMRFYERKEIKDVLAYARFILNEADELSLLRALNEPARHVGETSVKRVGAHALERGLSLWEAFRVASEIPGLHPKSRHGIQGFVETIEALRGDLGKAGASAGLEMILERSGYLAALEREAETDAQALSRIANLQELINATKDFEAKSSEPATLGDYLNAVSLLGGDHEADDPAKPAVTLMTVHLAKGLEFPVVFLTGLEEGLFPIGSDGRPENELEEERRLAYVGMTRAKDRLYLTYAHTRRLFGQIYANLPSRFIIETGLFTAPHEPSPSSHPFPSRGDGDGRDASSAEIHRRLSRVSIGMRVRHPSFGMGRILDFSGSGETSKLTVRFDDGRTARLLLRYAPLEPA